MQGHLPPASKSILKAQQESSQAPIYKGGILTLDTSNLPKSPNPDDIDLTHVQVGYEAMGMDDGDIYGMTVLGVLLGGGGSFSAGGVKRFF
jgi:mitochondrial-processing peptidase subunit alpha